MNKGLKTLTVAAAGSALALLGSAAAFAQTGTVTSDLLNVRTAPSTDSSIAGMLSWGDTVTITYEPGNGWYEIYLNGGCYYVCGDYISTGYSSGSSYDSYESCDSYESYDSYDSYDDYGTYEDTTSSAQQGTYLGNFALTAYCGCAACCGTAGNLTASGTVPEAGRTVAMGGVDFGTQLLINGHVYTVEDRGTPYGVVDIFCSSHAEACAFGMQYADVYVLN